MNASLPAADLAPLPARPAPTERNCLFVTVLHDRAEWSVIRESEIVDTGSAETLENVHLIQQNRHIEDVIIDPGFRVQEALEAAHHYGWKTLQAGAQSIQPAEAPLAEGFAEMSLAKIEALAVLLKGPQLDAGFRFSGARDALAGTGWSDRCGRWFYLTCSGIDVCIKLGLLKS